MNRPEEPRGDVTAVAIGVIRDGEAYLVGQRGPGPLAGCAEFPGGKCLPGETLEACVVRECREETGLDAVVLCRLQQVEHQYDHGRLCLTFFLCEPVGRREPTPPFRWVVRYDLARLPFPEANRAILERITKGEL